MPGGSGMELIEKIKRKWPHTSVIVYSAVAHLHKVACENMGVYACLVKPSPSRLILNTVRKAAEKQKTDAEAKKSSWKWLKSFGSENPVFLQIV
jgi:two-component system nitrogen regulation response regulator GlnG